MSQERRPIGDVEEVVKYGLQADSDEPNNRRVVRTVCWLSRLLRLC